MNNAAHPLQGWIPYRLRINNGQINCYWLNTHNQPYTEPFFLETISMMRGAQQSTAYRHSVSDLSMLLEWAGHIDHIAPTAFIFHVSRCGSTLISQLLGVDSQNISLSEVPIFDDILRLPYKVNYIDKDYSDKLLLAAMKFYGQKRTGTERHLFIKTDSWHVHFYRQLRDLYPQTPFVLLYRTPNEVFESHTKQRGTQAVPGLLEPEIFGFNRDEVFDLDEYLAKVLASYFEAYLKIISDDDNYLLLNYNEGIMALMDKMALAAKLQLSDTVKDKMKDRSNYHSKYPDKLFTETMKMEHTQCLQQAFNLYQQVEQKRPGMVTV